MKKLTALFLLSTAFTGTPASAEITGYFENTTRPAHVKPRTAEMVNITTPNLMSVAVKHRASLTLSERQQAAIRLWQEDHARHMRFLMHKTAVIEKASVKKALKGQDKARLMAEVDKANAMRKEIASLKLDCRDNLRKILNDGQWKKLVTLYKADAK